MCGLCERVNACIGPPRTVNGHPTADDACDGCLKRILHGSPGALALPSAECSAVIGDHEPQLHEGVELESSQLCRICTAAAWSIMERCSRLLRPAS